MEWILAALAIAVLGLALAAMSGRFGELPDVVDDRDQPDLPSRPLAGDDLRDVTFAVVPRGYDMEQVDAVLRRVADQLDRPADPVPEPVVAGPGPSNLE